MTCEIARWRLLRLKNVLINNGVIAYPTEGVWGLGCLPECREAVERLLILKRRSMDKGLILVAASIDQLAPYLDSLDESALDVLRHNWPGPVTYLVPDRGMAPKWIKGSHRRLALRVSAHPVVSALCKVTGPLVSTSANVSGHAPALNSLRVRQYFSNRIDDLCPGELGGSAGPSEIRDLCSNQVVRH